MTIQDSGTESQREPLPAEAIPFVLPDRDVRRKRPPFLSFLLRLETLRRAARVASLLVLDFVGVAGAVFTALALKLALKGNLDWSVALSDAKRFVPFAYLITVLMFARADLYADRPRRPGLASIATALFQTTIISLVFALASGEHFSSYYIFYASLFFGVVYIAALRDLHLRITGWLLEQAGYHRRALLVGSGKHIEAVAHALAGRSRMRVDIAGYISLTPRPQNGLRSLGTLEELPEVLAGERIQEVIIADPEFPEEQAVELVDLCHQRGVTVQVAPSTMEILIDRAEFVPGQTVPLFKLRPPVMQGIDYALKRTFDLVLSTIGLIVLGPVLLAIAIAVKPSSTGARDRRSMRPGIAGKPFDCFKFRTTREHAEADPGGPGAAERELRRAVQDPSRPAADQRRPVLAPVLARRAPAARQRDPRRDVAGGSAAAPDAGLPAASRSGTRSAIWCCPGSPGCGRSRAAPSSTSTTSCGSTSCT